MKSTVRDRKKQKAAWFKLLRGEELTELEKKLARMYESVYQLQLQKAAK